MGSSSPHEPRRLPTGGRSTSYPFPPPTMQPNSFISGATYAVDPPIRLANSTPHPSGSLSIQQSPQSASAQQPTLPSFNTLIESIHSPEPPLRSYDGRSSHTANPPARLPSSRPYGPNSVTMQQNQSSASSPLRQVPPLDFTRPGRLLPPILKSNLSGDPGLPLPRSNPSNVSRLRESNTITPNRSMDLGNREGHDVIGRIIPGSGGIIVGYAGGDALDPQIAQLDSSYRCDQCLEWHVDLASHRKTHLEVRRFACSYCKKRFKIDDIAASFSRPTKKTLINAFHRLMS